MNQKFLKVRPEKETPEEVDYSFFQLLHDYVALL
jgi:hypothetical protein